MSFKPTVANASPSGSCAGSYPFGLAAFYGYSNCNYFSPGTTQNPTPAGDVLSSGLTIPAGTPSAQLTNFENQIYGYLTGGVIQDETGAAFIIDTMLQEPANSSSATISYATNNFSAWEARVSDYNSKELIEYNHPFNWVCGSVDSAYDPAAGHQDDFYFSIESSSVSNNQCGPNSIVNTISFFNTSGALLYRINTDCGNPAGDGLPALATNPVSGTVLLKNTTTNVVTNVPNSDGLSVTLTDNTDLSESTTVPVQIINGTSKYNLTIPDGDHFSLSLGSGLNGYTGPYTDYQGAANFIDAASGLGAPYNCGPTNYLLQVAGTPSTPDNNGRSGSATCADVGSNSSYNFIYLNSSPGGSSCSSLSSSGTSPTFTVTASYTVASGVSYKSASFNWGDGSITSGGTNSNGKVTSVSHTYTTSGTYTITATISFSSSSSTVPNSSCTTTVIVGGQSGSGPVFTCNTGSYDVTAVVNPDTPYIGADYTNSSITFNSSGNFESDNNNPYNDNLSLSPYANQNSQLTVEATGSDSGLGINSPVTYNLIPGNNTAGTLSIQTPVGIYSAPYQVKVVEVVTDPNPAAHWAPIPSPNPTKESPSPPSASSYTNKTTSVGAPVYTTVEAPGDPTTGYYTQEKTTTTYTYTKTASTPGPTTYTCPSGWTPPSGSSICTRTEASGKKTTIPATPHTGTPTTTTTTVATDYSYQYNYYITWVSTPNVECPPPASVKVGYQPYMKVYGGDVMAGSTFDPGLTTACTPLLPGQDSSIIGWNYDTSPNYSGAGTEFAGYALGGIDGFATNQVSQASSGAGIGLSFANTSNNSPSSGGFGGTFGRVSCAPDFYDAMPASASSLNGTYNLGSLASGSYQSNSITISGSVNTGNHVAIYVNGNANISGNITLSGTWDSVSQIPSFELIVKNGNIYIDGSVTRLDGVYVAQGGTIYDCSVNDAPASGVQFSNNCDNSLVVNGAFIATQVDLMRTSSSSSNTLYRSNSDPTTSGGSDSASESGNASEVFNYSPAIWLGLTTNNWLGSGGSTNLNNYNSITSLPPVL